LSEDLTVSITDNDFQRSYAADQLKVPSDGNNKIIYDLDLSANDKWYTLTQNHSEAPYSGSQAWRFRTGESFQYDLGSGGDYLTISSGLQTAIKGRTLLF
jgi:hypothetical protein